MVCLGHGKSFYSNTRGYQNVCRLVRWNQYLIKVYNLIRNIKQKMFNKLWEIFQPKLCRLLIILPSNTKYMIWSPSQSTRSSMMYHNIIVFQVYSLYLNAYFAKYTILCITIKFDAHLSQINKVLQRKREFS